MAELNFPDPSDSPTYEQAGIIWTWSETLKAWISDGNDGFTETDGDGRYLRKDATAGAQTVETTNKTTFSGPVDFSGQTTHAGGVKVSGGDENVDQGLYAPNDTVLEVATDGVRAARFGGILSQNYYAGLSGYGRDMGGESKNCFSVSGGVGSWSNVGSGGKVSGIYVNLSSITGAASNVPVAAFRAETNSSSTYTNGNTYAFHTNISSNTNQGGANNNWAYYSGGSAPSYFKGGIQFDLAAKGAGSNQGLNLNAYERGIWSPRIGATGGNPLEYNVTQLDTPVYEKIGNLIYISCRIRIDSIANAGNNTGNLSVFNLPFNVPAERFISTVTCGFTGLSLKVEAGLIQANQMSLMVNAVANNYTRQLITATATNRDALAVVQIAGIYKSS